MKVRITLENKKYIDVELYEDIAPITVKNFIKLANEGFYNGTIFHRIIKDFMVQGGGFIVADNQISRKEAENIKGEFKSNGVENNLKHTYGVISMARAMPYDSASSQFFICTGDFPHLDGEYAAFGKKIGDESKKTLKELNDAPTRYVEGGLADFPYPIIRIETIEVL